MSHIYLNSKAKRGSRSRKSLSQYASFSLCLAAAAITIGAAAMRAQKDRTALSAEPQESSVSSYESSDISRNANTQPVEPSGTTAEPARQAASVTDNRTETAAKPDEFEDLEEMEDSEQTLAIQVLGKNLTYIRPAGGAVTKDYSMDGLVYSKTMGDWRVHQGLDIAANQGEVVKSAAEGKVSGITHDPLYGTTVVVNQNDGLMVYYRGLAKEPAVREGENISAGATIGTVGDIPCESGDGVHLHIEVMQDGKYLDPKDALGIK